MSEKIRAIDADGMYTKTSMDFERDWSRPTTGTTLHACGMSLADAYTGASDFPKFIQAHSHPDDTDSVAKVRFSRLTPSRLHFPAACLQNELGIAVGLLTSLEDQVHGGLEGDVGVIVR